MEGFMGYYRDFFLEIVEWSCGFLFCGENFGK